MTRIYRYILDSDTGMAPCPQNGLISLGVCKPQIRKHARKGDWVAGFMPGSEHRSELVWAGKVSETLTQDGYRKRLPDRRDAIYGRDKSGEYQKHLCGYHCDLAQQKRDRDNPVLLFDQASARYFGRAPEHLPDNLIHLAAKGRPIRVNFRIDGDLAIWEDWLHHLPSKHREPRDVLILCSGCEHCSNAQEAGPSCGCNPRSKKRPGKNGG